MPRILSTLAALMVLTVAVNAAEPPEEDARTLVKRALDTLPDVPYVSQMKLTTSGGLVREVTMNGKHLANGIQARYLEVTGPFNLKDTRYLFYEREERRDDQFMYIPFMKRIIRLSERTRREPFLGSTFFVDDVIARPLDDFTYRFVGSDVIGQRSCRLVECVPKDVEHEVYGKSVVAIDPIDLVVMRVQLYDRDGKLFKVLNVEKIEKIDGYWTPLQQTMDNVQDGTTSKMVTASVEYNAPIGDEIFGEAHLGR